MKAEIRQAIEERMLGFEARLKAGEKKRDQAKAYQRAYRQNQLLRARRKAERAALAARAAA